MVLEYLMSFSLFYESGPENLCVSVINSEHSNTIVIAPVISDNPLLPSVINKSRDTLECQLQYTTVFLCSELITDTQIVWLLFIIKKGKSNQNFTLF